MTDKTRKIIVFSLCGLALTWAFWTITRRDNDRTLAVPAQGEITVLKAELPRLREDSTRLDSLEKVYTSIPWGKDPFYHDVPVDSHGDVREEPEFHLVGILYRQLKAQALIDNRIVMVGDRMNGYKVMEITPNSVTLNDGQRSLTLRLEKESM